MYYDKIVRTDYKKIGFHVRRNRRKSGLGGGQETYMKTNFSLDQSLRFIVHKPGELCI
jgi:hypothetical protein